MRVGVAAVHQPLKAHLEVNVVLEVHKGAKCGGIGHQGMRLGEQTGLPSLEP